PQQEEPWSPPPSRRARTESGPAGWLLLRFVCARLGGKGRDEGLLRDLDPPDGLHPLLAFLLLLQQLALAGDVTAVALREDVLANGADVLPRDDARPDRRLDRHLELLARDQRSEEHTSELQSREKL